jgi:hypothetical protein
MDNRYFLLKGNHKDDRYSFIELYDSIDRVYYRIDNGKIQKDFLLDFNQWYHSDHKIQITEEKFNWILQQKFLIRNVNEPFLLKILGLHEWII